MHLSCVLLFLYANFALATRYKPLPPRRVDVGHGVFVARQVFNPGGGDCTEESTCSECYGSGNVLCDNAGCFDPSQGEQCCKGGTYCDGTNNSCCGSTGPGITGTDGVVPQSAYSALDTETATATGGWECFPTDTNEECCRRGGKHISWCGGNYPTQICYNPSSAVCCNNGDVCTGKSCCNSFGAVATTRNPSVGQATDTPTPPNGPSNTPQSQPTTSPPTSALTATVATPTATPTNSSNAGSGLGAVKGTVGLLGAFIVGLMAL